MAYKNTRKQDLDANVFQNKKMKICSNCGRLVYRNCQDCDGEKMSNKSINTRIHSMKHTKHHKMTNQDDIPPVKYTKQRKLPNSEEIPQPVNYTFPKNEFYHFNPMSGRNNFNANPNGYRNFSYEPMKSPKRTDSTGSKEDLVFDTKVNEGSPTVETNLDDDLQKALLEIKNKKVKNKAAELNTFFKEELGNNKQETSNNLIDGKRFSTNQYNKQNDKQSSSFTPQVQYNINLNTTRPNYSYPSTDYPRPPRHLNSHHMPNDFYNQKSFTENYSESFIPGRDNEDIFISDRNRAETLDRKSGGINNLSVGRPKKAGNAAGKGFKFQCDFNTNPMASVPPQSPGLKRIPNTPKLLVSPDISGQKRVNNKNVSQPVKYQNRSFATTPRMTNTVAKSTIDYDMTPEKWYALFDFKPAVPFTDPYEDVKEKFLRNKNE